MKKRRVVKETTQRKNGKETKENKKRKAKEKMERETKQKHLNYRNISVGMGRRRKGGRREGKRGG